VGIRPRWEGRLSCRKAFAIEFRNDVVTVALKGEAFDRAQVAKDFGVSESCLQR
jgi:hypothetical protein